MHAELFHRCENRWNLRLMLSYHPSNLLVSLAGSAQLEVRLMPASQCFEVSSNGSLAVSGKLLLSIGVFWVTHCCVYSWLLIVLVLCVFTLQGKICLLEETALNNFRNQLIDQKDTHTEITLSKGDIYKELRLRGYDYGPTFQGLIESSSDGI